MRELAEERKQYRLAKKAEKAAKDDNNDDDDDDVEVFYVP